MRKTLAVKPITRNLNRVLKSAQNGNSKSMLKLGKHYMYVQFVAEESTENTFLLGIYWLSKAAQNKKWEACYWLGCAIESFWNHHRGGGAYLSAYMEEQKKCNTVWQEIMTQLNIEGFDEKTTSIDYENVCNNNLAAIWLWQMLEGFVFGGLSRKYYKVAAEHGITEAKARYGTLNKGDWDFWLELMRKGKSNQEVLKILADEDKSFDAVCHYYQTARYWLVEALRDGDDYVISDLQDLIEGRENLEKIMKTVK